jgi:hypothetical protein
MQISVINGDNVVYTEVITEVNGNNVVSINFCNTSMYVFFVRWPHGWPKHVAGIECV